MSFKRFYKFIKSFHGVKSKFRGAGLSRDNLASLGKTSRAGFLNAKANANKMAARFSNRLPSGKEGCPILSNVLYIGTIREVHAAIMRETD